MKPRANVVRALYEISNNFKNPLELIREALSNAHDAGASKVWIKTNVDEFERLVIEIKDNGRGMTAQDIHNFLNLGFSDKSKQIGEKGYGTKICYRSDEFYIDSVSKENGQRVRYKVKVKDSWLNLRNQSLPEPVITRKIVNKKHTHSKVTVVGFFENRYKQFTLSSLREYIFWNTIGGSSKPLFNRKAKPFQIQIDASGLEKWLNENAKPEDSIVTMSGKHRLPRRDSMGYRARYQPERSQFMCKHYGPKILKIPGIKIEIIGAVAGKRAKSKHILTDSAKYLMGVWFAKDYINIERVNEIVDVGYHSFHFIVNCNQFQLNANRNTIQRNRVFRAVKKVVRNYIRDEILTDPWFKRFKELNKLPRTKKYSKARLQRVSEAQTILTNPTNELEVAMNLVALASLGGSLPFELVEFHPKEKNFVAKGFGNSQPFFMNVVVSASDFFQQHHDLSELRALACWNNGILPESYLGKPVSAKKILRGRYRLQIGEQVLHLLVLSELLKAGG